MLQSFYGGQQDIYLKMLGSRFFDFVFKGAKITFQCFSETFVSGFGELCHPSVTSGDVGGGVIVKMNEVHEKIMVG